MREFGGYQIPSNEYRIMFEQVAQEKEHLMFKNKIQILEITALKKNVVELKHQLQSKDGRIEHLVNELKEQKIETKQCENDFEIQALKTERAHQVKMEAEEKVVKLERIVEKLKTEIVKDEAARTILINQRSTLEKKVKEQDVTLQEFVEANKHLDGRVADLENLCKLAKKRIDADEIKISELNENVTSLNTSLDLCDQFAVSVQNRDTKIKSCLANLIDHYERKMNSQCFLITKRQRKNRVFFMLEELMHVVGNDVEADGFPSGDPDRQLM